MSEEDEIGDSVASNSFIFVLALINQKLSVDLIVCLIKVLPSVH